MSLLTATSLTQSAGSVDVFDGLSVAIAHEQRIGLIGSNGIGKSTLLRMLAGRERPARGSVTLAEGVAVAYVQQEAMDAFEDLTRSVQDEMLAAFAHLRALQQRLAELEARMAGGDAGANVLTEYGHLHERFEARGGYHYESRIAPMLAGLGLSEHAARPLAQLSGGQRRRALLARELLASPDVLILDEPTNHLDLQAVEWLEQLLLSWPGALVVCSHDRRFLDRVVTTIWDMRHDAYERVRLDVYRGNYAAYAAQRADRHTREMFLWDQEKARLDNELRLIKRDLDDVKAGNDKSVVWAKGKLKRLTRDALVLEQLGVEALRDEQWMALAQRIEGSTRPWGLEEAQRRLAALRRPALPQSPRLQLRAANRGSEIVVRADHLVVGFEHGAPLFRCDELVLRRGRRAALLGANGSGKTTLIRTLFGEIAPLGGEIMLGPSVRAGYFAQAHDALDLTQRVLDELLRHAPGLGLERGRHHLAQFLFRGDDVFKLVSGLSGGERARLALAILALEDVNFLVLDEPTNHLDLPAQEVLQGALEGFDGTILLVSHDRHLIDALASEVWWIDGTRLIVHAGKYGDLRLALTGAQTADPASPRARGTGRSAADLAPASGLSKNQVQRKQRALEQAEVRIGELEGALRGLESELAITTAAERARVLGMRHAQTQAALDKALREWEALAQEQHNHG